MVFHLFKKITNAQAYIIPSEKRSYLEKLAPARFPIPENRTQTAREALEGTLLYFLTDKDPENVTLEVLTII